MLLNNGKAFLYFSDYGLDTDGNLIWNPQYELLRTNGISAIVERYTDKQPEGMNYSYLAGSLELIVGSGDTEPTVKDYKLENEIINSELVVLSKDSENLHNLTTKTYNDNYPIIEVTKTYKNNSLTESFTINEVGVIAKDKYGFSYLFIREVLEEPYIILPQETATFTLTLDYPGERSGNDWLKFFAYEFKHFLCPYNYTNGKNHAGGTERPLIIGLASPNTGSADQSQIAFLRGGIPFKKDMLKLAEKNSVSNTFYVSKNIICSPGTGYINTPSSQRVFSANGTHWCSYSSADPYHWTNMIIKSSLNTNNEFISYLNPIIAHACTTIKNESTDNRIVKCLALETSYSRATPASYYLTDEFENHILYNYDTSLHKYNYSESESTDVPTIIPLAGIEFDSEDYVTLAPGEMATFTFIIG
jgi:hypothetical protein